MGRRMIGVSRFGAHHSVKEGRGIAHAAGNHVVLRHAGPAFRPVRAGGDTAAGGLEADQAAKGGGDADGTAAIAAVRRRDDAGRHRRGRAAAGAARRAYRIPGVECRPRFPRLCSDRQRQLRRIGLAENHQSGLPVAAHQGGVLLRHEPVEETAGIPGGLSPIVGADILQQEGHAVQRTIPTVFGQSSAGAIMEGMHHRVDRGVAPFTTLNCRLQQFRGPDLTRAHQFGHADGVIRFVFGKNAHARDSNARRF